MSDTTSWLQCIWHENKYYDVRILSLKNRIIYVLRF